MSKNFVVFLAIGLVAVAVGISLMLVGTRGAHLRLDGKILKVRVIGTDEKSSIVVVDFRARNEAEVPFMIREGVIKVTTADGKESAGDTVARSDMDRVFEYYKLLGPKFNDVMVSRDRIAGGQSLDRMLAARFDLSAEEVEGRKNLTLTLNDSDGATFTFPEK